jgi:hypothetical protein
VRDEAALSKAFIASIAENGVLIPITGVRHPDNAGVVRLRNGQRRTLAAREVGLPTISVYVLPATVADASQETIDRIVHQIVTNDQKQDLTDAQRARGIQMIDAGMSVSKVAIINRVLCEPRPAARGDSPPDSAAPARRRGAPDFESAIPEKCARWDRIQNLGSAPNPRIHSGLSHMVGARGFWHARPQTRPPLQASRKAGVWPRNYVCVNLLRARPCQLPCVPI